MTPAFALLAAAALPPLQPLIDAAPPGSVLVPPPGRYAGPVVITRALTLDGAGRVTVDGQGTGSVITIRAEGVTLRRLHITGSGTSHDHMDGAITVEADHVEIRHNDLDNTLFGVQVNAAHGVLVCGNTIRSTRDEPGLRGDGVRIWNGNHNTVSGNDIVEARDVTFANARDNLLAGNRVAHGRYGLQMVFAPRNRVEDNQFESNLTGIAVLYSDDVVIRRNRVVDSQGVSGVGVVFKESSQGVVEDNAFVRCSVGARTNSPTHPLNVVYFRRNLFAHNTAGMDFYGENGGHVIEHNRFDHNLVQVTVSAPMSARGNGWLGNEWDDYQGFDRDGDGVGDQPYERFAFADRIWLETPSATFFRNSPVLELLDFLERLAPFSNPELVLRDPRPAMTAAGTGPAGPPRERPRFIPSCPGDVP
ncbi:MAG: nitrous oxide reductase family maturation protein NosD [Deltaproteobacteria bacterium]|nr:nitrous oxide reductase family maturation protein NosD [Deltaproteobacteria bacterium]